MKCKYCGEPLTYKITDLSHVYCKKCKKTFRMPKKRQAKIKKMMMMAAVGIVLILIILGLIIKGVVGYVSSVKKAPKDIPPATAEKDISELQLKIENPIDITSTENDFQVTFQSAKLVTDATGNNAVVLEIDFVSTRENPQSFHQAVTVSARQGETRLEESALKNAKALELADPDSLHEQGDLDTYTIVYKIVDTVAPIVVEMYDTNTPDAASATQTIEFQVKEK